MASEVQKEIFIWSVSGERKSLNFSRGWGGGVDDGDGDLFLYENNLINGSPTQGAAPPAQNQGSGPRDPDDLARDKHTTPSCCQATFPFSEKGEVWIK